MKKKVLLITAMALLCCALFAVGVSAATEGYYTYEITDGYATITDVDNEAVSGSVTVPSTLGGAPVTAIGAQAFDYCMRLTGVSIPEGITSIGEGAFSGCTRLTAITIPASVVSVAPDAFTGCMKLTDISVDGINPVYCDVDGVLFSKDLTVLYNCPMGKTYTDYQIPPSVTSIGAYAFADCSSLKSVAFTGNLTSIGDYAFVGCIELGDVTIPSSVTSIGVNAFWCCDAVANITVDSKNTVYCDVDGVLFSKDSTVLHAYPNGKDYTSYEIPDGVTAIDACAFYGIYKLRSITIADSVVSIGEYAFRDCTGLTDITIPGNVRSIGAQAFRNCHNLARIDISEGVLSIGDRAFTECSSLVNVVIPASVTSIGKEAFFLCDRITVFIVSADNPNYCALEGVLFSKDLTALYHCPAANARTDYELPIYVTSIADSAFLGCQNITAIALPEGLVSIGVDAFSGCCSLSDITIPSSVTSIGAGAFACCESLTGITLPAGITSIGDNAFYGCSGLVNITVPESVTSIGEWAFSSCSGLTSITIPASVISIGAEAFLNCPSLTIFGYAGSTAETYAVENDIPFTALVKEIASGTCGDNLIWVLTEDGTLTISGTGNMTNWAGAAALPWNDYKGLIQTVVIENGVTSIGDFAFYPCEVLRQITIPEGVTSIGHAAFFNCSSLGEIAIPSSVTSISEFAFAKCISLKNITVADGNAYYSDENGVLFNKGKTVLLRYPAGKTDTVYAVPDGVESIGYQAFRSSPLTEITLPTSVTSIGENAFVGSTGLVRIMIPESVSFIGAGAFDGCPSLTISGYAGSTAETYAKENNIPFETISSVKEIASGTCGDNLTWVLTDDGTLTISGTGAMPDWKSSNGAPWYNYRASVKRVDIGPGVTFIAGYAFWKFQNLTEICVDDANLYYSDVNGVVFSKDGTQLIQYPTGRQDAQYAIPSGVTSILRQAFADSEYLTGVTFPEGLLSLEGSAFARCLKLASLGTIPASVTSIHAQAFMQCTSLSDIQVHENNANYCDVDGVLFSKDKTSLHSYPAAKTGESYTVPDSVVRLESDAFSHNQYLRTIDLPDKLDSIGVQAFTGCTNLQSIDLPASVRSIGSGAFQNCRLLASFTFPPEVTSVARNMFNQCERLTAIVIPAKVSTISSRAFSNCKSLTSVTVLNPDAVIETEVFLNSKNITISGYAGSTAETYAKENNILFTVLPVSDEVASGVCGENLTWKLTSDGTLTISGTGAMGGWGNSTAPWYSFRDSILKVVVGDGVTSIAGYAFDSHKNLTSVTIPSSVTAVDICAFARCTALTEITIPNSVTSLGEFAFYNSTALASVTLSANITSIGQYTFGNCAALAEITIPDGVTSIGEGAFSGCTALKRLTIPASVTSIEPYAFPTTVSILVYAGSAAETYAKEKNLTFAALSADGSLSGVCGEDLTWKLTTDGKLTVSGTGAMRAWTSSSKVPWDAYRSSIKTAVLEEGVTSIGAYAFVDCVNLTGVTVPDSFSSGNPDAFTGSPNCIIYGHAGTNIERFAKAFNLPFVAITASVKGDVNGDGTFDYYDVATLYAVFRGKATLAAGASCDIDESGAFDYYDVARLYAIYRGKAEFPA